MGQSIRKKDMLDVIAHRWAMLILQQLHMDNQRFIALKKGIPGISQRMLTLTLRRFAEAKLVTRHVMGEQHVEYRLTEKGQDVAQRLLSVLNWVHWESLPAQ
jgi:DNA-binding HxlR family transcriptional regulator